MITILNIVYKLSVGGAEKVLVDIVNRASKDYRHIICSLSAHDDFAHQLDQERSFIIDMGRRSGNDWRMPFAIARVIRQERVDLVHCIGWATYVEGYLGAILQMKRPKFVFAFHGKIASDLSGIPKRRILAQRMLAKTIDGIVTPSMEMRNDYARTIGITTDSIEVIYNGVDTDLYRPSDYTSAVRESFGFLPHHQVIGCVARFDSVKNIPNLVRGFALCRNAFPDARLFLVGDGSERSQVSRMITDLNLSGWVVLPGKRSDVDHCLQAMDLYVQPSHYEGMPIAILEAMSCGLPIITTNVGGIPEVVVNRLNGILLDRPEPKPISEALCTLLSDRELQRSYSTQSRRIAQEKFSVDTMVKSYENYFAKLIGRQ